MKDPCATTNTSVIERDDDMYDEKELETRLALPVCHPSHGVVNGKSMTVVDYASNLKVDLVVKHSPDLIFEEGEAHFKLVSHSGGDIPNAGNAEDDDVTMVDKNSTTERYRDER
eukprot:TRINITY_DN1604_c0_g1_i4.p1 TRINITY_DN1604_c0_g1~~TRINITY_DN1604_c0_g1_i4.p1  ORF type:complete len:114 (-),score=25.47 TRINITY_DN1604_c0_g1_i4:124-465(-)